MKNNPDTTTNPPDTKSTPNVSGAPDQLFSREQCEALLSDYAQGQLTEEQSLLFEQSISLFPEINDSVKAFRQMETMLQASDYRGMLDRRSRNVGVRVHDALDRSARKRVSFGWIGTWAPVITVAVALVFFMIPAAHHESSLPAFDEEMEELFSSTTADSLEQMAEARTDFSIGDGASPVFGFVPSSGDDLDGLHDVAEKLVAAAQSGNDLSQEQKTLESLDLLLASELQDLEVLTKELEHVSNM